MLLYRSEHRGSELCLRYCRLTVRCSAVTLILNIIHQKRVWRLFSGMLERPDQVSDIITIVRWLGQNERDNFFDWHLFAIAGQRCAHVHVVDEIDDRK